MYQSAENHRNDSYYTLVTGMTYVTSASAGQRHYIRYWDDLRGLKVPLSYGTVTCTKELLPLDRCDESLVLRSERNLVQLLFYPVIIGNDIKYLE